MIFLGQASNYSFGRALKHLFAHGSKRDAEQLKQALWERYGGGDVPAIRVTDTFFQEDPESRRGVAPRPRDDGRRGRASWKKSSCSSNLQAQVALYHTGRSALAAAFSILAPKGSKIIIPGLTCIAVVRAVRAAGCEPVFMDIDPETLQYDFKKLENYLKTTQKPAKSAKPIDKNENVCYNVSIIVAQNTLGLPLDMQKLEQIANQYHLKIVEDLAHSAGRFYPDGREIGTVGAATALSFGKGKAIDTIEGGALVLREEAARELHQPTRRSRWADRWRDRWYPVLGNIIRAGYHVGLGKVFTGIFLQFHWLARSADAELDLDVQLSSWQAKLAQRQLAHLPKTPLREHYFVSQRSQLLAELAKKGYYLNEIWYDTPVSPARYAKEAAFPVESCPATVKVAAEIINLPTWYSEKQLAPVRQIIDQHLAKSNHQPGREGAKI